MEIRVNSQAFPFPFKSNQNIASQNKRNNCHEGKITGPRISKNCISNVWGIIKRLPNISKNRKTQHILRRGKNNQANRTLS